MGTRPGRLARDAQAGARAALNDGARLMRQGLAEERAHRGRCGRLSKLPGEIFEMEDSIPVRWASEAGFIEDRAYARTRTQEELCRPGRIVIRAIHRPEAEFTVGSMKPRISGMSWARRYSKAAPRDSRCARASPKVSSPKRVLAKAKPPRPSTWQSDVTGALVAAGHPLKIDGPSEGSTQSDGLSPSAHNVASKDEVDDAMAESAQGRRNLFKEAQDTFDSERGRLFPGRGRTSLGDRLEIPPSCPRDWLITH